MQLLNLLPGLFLILAAPAFAAEATAIRAGLRALSQLSSTLQRDPSCFVGEESSGQTCASVSDSFCQELWDVNGGNQKVFDGQVLLGSSPKSGLSQAQMIDLRALVDGEERFPPDLREQAGPIVARLREALSREKSGVQWKREVSDLLREFGRAQEDVAAARTKSRFPRGFRGVEERFYTRRIQAELSDQILQAKYADHPNWKRVERLFPQAKEDLLKAIDSLPLPPERKQAMAERLRTVQLALPSSNPESVDAGESCGTTSKGAFYFPSIHTVTVCAGLFNSLQSDSALFTSLMHEISHSVDPTNLGRRDYQRESPVAQKLQKLKGAKGAPIRCEDWKNVVNEVLKPENPSFRHNELDKLYSCLEPRNGMIVWNYRRVKDVAMRKPRTEISDFARDEGFTTLVQPSHTEGGKTVENELYFRPDLLLLNRYKRPTALDERPEHVAEIFTQVAQCQTLPRGEEEISMRSQDLSKEDRARLFNAALSTTEKLLRRRAEAEYTFCGRNCEDLVPDNSARNANESFADWLANRASWRHFARIPSSRDRREASALAWAHLCEDANLSREAPELAAEEKRHSLEEHPDNRRRRLSIFDDVSANLLGCRYEPGLQESYGKCEP